MKKYVILTTLGTMDNWKPNASDYYFPSPDKDIVIKGHCSTEPQVKYFLAKYPVCKIVALASKEARKEYRGQKTIHDIAKWKIPDKENMVYLFFRSIQDFLLGQGETPPYTHCPKVALEIVPYKTDTPSSLGKILSALSLDGNTGLLIDIQGGARTTQFVQTQLIPLINTEKNIVECIASCKKIQDTSSYRIVKETEIYRDMQTLVSGVNAFITYGSTDLLKEYFKGKKPSAEQQELLSAMENFSHAISLSDSSEIVKGVEELRQKFEICQKAEGQKNSVFKLLLERMQSNFSALLTEDDTFLLPNILQWCVNKGYLQQALTLFESQTSEPLFEIFSVTGRLPFDIERTSEAGAMPWNWSNTLQRPEFSSEKEKKIGAFKEFLDKDANRLFKEFENYGSNSKTKIRLFKNFKDISPEYQQCCIARYCAVKGTQYVIEGIPEIDISETSLKKCIEKYTNRLKNNQKIILLLIGEENDQKFGDKTEKAHNISRLIRQYPSDQYPTVADYIGISKYYLAVKIARNMTNHGQNPSENNDVKEAKEYFAENFGISISGEYEPVKELLKNAIQVYRDIIWRYK